MAKNDQKNFATGGVVDAQKTAAELAEQERLEAAQLAAEKALVEKMEKDALENSVVSQLDELAKQLEAKKDAPRYYRAAHGGLMIDPTTQKRFHGDAATKSELTGWLEFQIQNGKIVEDTE